MLAKTLLATTAIGAALFAVAAALPAITDSRGGDTASPPVTSYQTLAQAPAQDIRQANEVGRLWKAERRRDKRHDDGHDSEREIEHDRARDQGALPRVGDATR